MTKKPNMRKLQRLIDRAAEAATAHHLTSAALNDYCIEIYGTEPGEVDADRIIDAVLGGSGTAPGMTAESFDEAMREAAAS